MISISNNIGAYTLDLLKTIYSFLDYKTGYEVLQVDSWFDKTEYDVIFNTLKGNLYSGLCKLDANNLEKLFRWAVDMNERMSYAEEN